MNLTGGFGYIPAKSIHYQSDGSGRDTYIGINNGGLMVTEENKTAFSIGNLQYLS